MADSASIAGTAGAADRVAAAHEALLRQPGFQFEFEAQPPPPELPDWLRDFLQFLAGLFEGTRPFFQILFWTAIAILAGLILYFVVREAVRHYRKEGGGGSAKDDAVPDWRPPVARARGL